MEHNAAFAAATFDRNYQLHLKHLTLKGLQPKTVKAYSRAIRRIGAYFDQRIDALTEAQLVEKLNHNSRCVNTRPDPVYAQDLTPFVR